MQGRKLVIGLVGGYFLANVRSVESFLWQKMTVWSFGFLCHVSYRMVFGRERMAFGKE